MVLIFCSARPTALLLQLMFALQMVPMQPSALHKVVKKLVSSVGLTCPKLTTRALLVLHTKGQSFLDQTFPTWCCLMVLMQVAGCSQTPLPLINTPPESASSPQWLLHLCLITS